MAMTPLPTPAPSRGQPPAEFVANADAMVAALPTFVTEANALQTALLTTQDEVEATQVLAAANQAAAAISETNAANSAAAASAASGALGLTAVVVTGTSQAATAGNLYILQNVATTTVTLPVAPSNGHVVGVLVANGISTNIIARNGKNIQNIAEDLTIDSDYATVILRYIDSTTQWSII